VGIESRLPEPHDITSAARSHFTHRSDGGVDLFQCFCNHTTRIASGEEKSRPSDRIVDKKTDIMFFPKLRQ